MNYIIIVFIGISTSLIASQEFKKIENSEITNENLKSFGAVWFDYNSDGKEDLLVGNMAEHNSLFINLGGGKFKKIENSALTKPKDNTFGISLADFNNDGLNDIYISNFGQANLLYQANKSNGFELTQTIAVGKNESSTNGSAWVDINNDSFLDLYTVNGNNQNNALYQYNGSVFVHLTDNSLSNDGVGAHSSSWSDYDNDGDLDVFISTNYAGKNLLFRNDGDFKFSQITSGEIATDIAVSIGASWADIDNDGDMDIYVSNSFDANNFLYANNGEGLFSKITNSPTTIEGGNSMSNNFIDYDNDGDLDLYVANSGNQANLLFENTGNGVFRKITNSVLIAEKKASRGVLWNDFDQDGDLDLFITNAFGEDDRNDFFINKLSNGNNSIQLKLIGAKSNRSAIGSRIRIKTKKGWQLREISQQNGSYSNLPLRVHFGIGSTTVVEELEISWPSGMKQKFNNLKFGFYQVIEANEITKLDI